MQPQNKSAVSKVRPSKFRHLFGTASQNTGLSECIHGLKLGSVQTESNVLKANPTFIAVPWGVTGCIGVVSTSFKGSISPEFPLIVHEETTVNDFAFHPFDDYILASACNDGNLVLWKLPEGEMTQNLTSPMKTITATDKRLLSVDFHPLANNVVISLDSSKLVKFFDLESGTEMLTLPDVHKALVSNLSWSYDGSQVATSCKDKKLRIFDPRANKCVAEAPDHQGTKGGRVVWLGRKNFIFTCGFSTGTERQMALYDPRNLSSRLTLQSIDNSSSGLMPFYDADNSVMFLAGKGDGNIRYYEIVDTDPYIHYLNEFKSKDPQSGMAALPKQVNDVMKCEIMRLLKLQPKGSVVPLRFEVPRTDNQFFQDDIFPDTFDGKPSMTASEWFGGANNPPNLMSLNPEKRG